MKRIAATTIFLLAVFSLVLGQEPIIEYGEESELKGVKKVYVHTAMDLELHRNISKDIKKKLWSAVASVARHRFGFSHFSCRDSLGVGDAKFFS